jgi:hypothetical protein
MILIDNAANAIRLQLGILLVIIALQDQQPGGSPT